MKRKIFSVLFALVLVVSFSLVTAVPAAVSANGNTFAGSPITVMSITPVVDLTAEAFDAEPETLELDEVPFDAQTSPVIIEGQVSDLDLGDGWVDTAYVEIGLRPETTMNARNAGVFLIALNAPAATQIHLQDYTGGGRSGGVIEIAKDNAFRYKITLEPSGDTGGTATLEVWIGDASQGTVSDFAYGYASDWQERTEPLGGVVEDFSNAHLFYSIIADRRGVEGQTYSATVGDITIDDTLYVGAGQQFPTIQDAINAALPGHIISVAAGTYDEQLTIDQSLTLQGSGTPTIDVSGYTGDTDNGVTITASDVTIDGFEIIGIPMSESGTDEEVYYADAKANKWQTINVGGSDAAGGVSNIEVKNCDFAVNSGDKGHIAMYVHDSCSVVSFTHNTVTGYLRGIYAHASRTTQVNNLTVDDNQFDMVSFQRDDMNFWGGFDYTVSSAVTLNTGENFKVTDNIFNGPGTFPTRGADPDGICNVYAMADFISYFTTNPTEDYVVDFSRNQITNFYLGMCTMGAGGYMADNDIGSNLIGIQIGQLSATWATGETEAVSITGNDITDNNVGIDVQNFVADGIAAHNNDIVGNTDCGVQNSDTDEFDATNNWWGSASGPTHASNTYTVPAGDAQGNAVSDLVDFVPWLNEPYDTGVSFAPVENADTGEQFSSIQAAIDDVGTDADDIISVTDGTYSATIDNSILLEGENHGYCFVHIDKSISLIGDSRDGVILDGTALQGEDRCTGIWVSVSNVIVKNLTIQNFKNTAVPDTACYGLYVMEKFRDYTWGNVALLQYVTAENIKAANNTCPIYFMKTEYAMAKDCVIDNNTDDGIWVAWGSHHATVQGNIVTNSGDHGIWVGQSWMGQGHGSNNATIINNTVNGTREAGISFVASYGAIISGNTITNAAAEHPSVGGWSVGALSLKDGPSNVEAFNNNIYNNDGSWDGHNGTGHGVGIDGTPSNINLYFNNIYGNTGDGCHNYSTVAVNAVKNYWGDPSGPDGDQGFGPEETYTGLLPGTGNKVSANVRCMPWLTRPFGKVLEDDIAYFGVSFPAQKGWNIVSAPLALDENVTVTVDGVEYKANTWGGLLNLGKIAGGDDYALKLHYTEDAEGKRTYPPIYYYVSDPESDDFGWQWANEFTEINPVDAFYIRMMAPDSFPVLFSPDLSVPSKKLYQGWNLVGCAYMDVMFAGEDGQPLKTALATIAEVSSLAGDVTGYSQVVSPPVNQVAWIYIPTPEGPGIYIPEESEGVILMGKGYWVFMENPGTLAGLTFTPISLGPK